MNREVFELFVELVQLTVALRDDLEGPHTRVVFLSHSRETSAPYVFEVSEQSLDHLLDIVRVLIHVLVGQEPPSLEHNGLVHLLVLLELFELFPDLAQLHVDLVLLFLAQRQFFVDVGFERVIRSLDLVFRLLVLRVVLRVIL